MILTRRRFSQLLITGIGLAAVPAWAANLVEGRDWRLLSPAQPSDAEPGKIEVLEFFSYGCPHCSDLNRVSKPWVATLPEDVLVRRVPVSFGRSAWANLGRLYYALDYTGDLDRLDRAVFDALHKERRRLFTEREILAWLGDQGVDTESFAKVFNSFGVHARLARSDQLVANYQVNAVPMIAVAGRYIVVGSEATGFGDLLVITEGLIDKARTELVG
ncbi:thiol:disulfide interchange protein DsbA/DsbL [Thioalkalicoccus limnaeus]|uniref:Thiol:disulfide interchange protein n=1 Tax=Thioalkalicoccus limnaeus TaxID=120681 RepID=A0ABV4BGZ5_9GAMM